MEENRENIETVQIKKTSKRRSWVASIVYCALCNIPVCFFLCLTSAISAATNIEKHVMTINFNNLSWLNIATNFVVAFVIAMCLGLFVPFTKIGRWFTALFGVKNDTYTGNVPYRLLATLITTIIYYLVVTPSLTVLNYFILRSQTAGQALLNMLINLPLMLLVGFVSSLLSDVFAYRVAHHINPEM